MARLSAEETVQRVRAAVPPFWTREGPRIEGKTYPLYRANVFKDHFDLCWGWKSFWHGRYIPRSEHDVRLHVRLHPSAVGTRISFWLASGPWGYVPLLLILVVGVVAMVAGMNGSSGGRDPFLWIVPLGWLASTLVRYPVSGENAEGRRLVEALLELSEATVLDAGPTSWSGEQPRGDLPVIREEPMEGGHSSSATKLETLRE